MHVQYAWDIKKNILTPVQHIQSDIDDVYVHWWCLCSLAALLNSRTYIVVVDDF